MTENELEMFIDYLLFHSNEDWPLDQTTEDFWNKVKKWEESKNEVK